MSFRRKRNLKFENKTTYHIYHLDDLSFHAGVEIEDYEEQKASGVDEEEEKEIHLQNVLSTANSVIPIPVIEEIKNKVSDFYEKKRLPSHINWQKDVENEYIVSDEDTKLLLDDLSENRSKDENSGYIVINNKTDIFLIEEYFVKKTKEILDLSLMFNTFNLDFYKSLKYFGEDPRYIYNIKNNEFVDFVLRRTIIRYDRINFEAYCCFKPRKIEPHLKSRKIESSMADKLELLKREFSIVDNLCIKEKKLLKYRKRINNTCFKSIKKYRKLFTNEIKHKFLAGKSSNANINVSVFRNRKRFLKTEDKMSSSFSDDKIIFNEDFSLVLVNSVNKITGKNKNMQEIHNSHDQNVESTSSSKIIYEDTKYQYSVN